MIHLVFLVSCFVVILLLHKLFLIIGPSRMKWKERRRLSLVALSMPAMTLLLFALCMHPSLLILQMPRVLQQSWQWYLVWGAMAVPLLLLGLTFVLGGVRLMSLYIRVHSLSWEAPASLKAGESGGYPVNFSVRLWYHRRPFAFILPALWPGTRARVILSTALLERLDSEELQAVLWHEIGHLCRGDFWITWLATWWRDAFFYLPSSWAILQSLRAGQEESCDAWVATVRDKRTTLALASALLKIWEDLFQEQRQGTQITSQAPGLAAEANPDLTEQRVLLLIEQAQTQQRDAAEGKGFARWSSAFALIGVVFAWCLLLTMIHFLLLSFGCDLSFYAR